MVVKSEMAKLNNIEPGTLIGYGGYYYIKTGEVEVDKEHVVKSICCDVITGTICSIDIRQNCSIYENAYIKLR